MTCTIKNFTLYFYNIGLLKCSKTFYLLNIILKKENIKNTFTFKNMGLWLKLRGEVSPLFGLHPVTSMNKALQTNIIFAYELCRSHKDSMLV